MSVRASEWMSRVPASEWIDMRVEKGEGVSERASERVNGFPCSRGPDLWQKLNGFQNLFSLR